MSMLGIDLGSWRCLVMYEYGGSFSTTVEICISQIKCLLGRKFSDPEFQLQLDYVPFRVIEGPDGCPLVYGIYNGEHRAFTLVEILTMLISSEYIIPEGYYDYSPFPCNIGVPIYFTDQQKKEVLEAANIVGFPASFGLDETIAMVVAQERLYGGQYIVAFIDIGHASMQVCFAEFKGSIVESTRSVNILYKGYARSLGGREFNKVLLNHFASEIRREYNIDVSANISACVRLYEACDRLKIALSENNEASICIENFSSWIDVEVSMTRKEFESLSISILKKFEVAFKKALKESGLNAENIDIIEVVGRGCSIPAIVDILTNIFGEKLNDSAYTYYRHVALGCAIQNITGTDKFINDLTTGQETSDLVSSELNSEEEKAEDSEKFTWRRAMDDNGHLLTFFSYFLQQNVHRIGRSEKTKDESYWLSKANFSEYSYSEIQDATNNFHESFKLGEGRYGIAYKGILNKTKTVAIKILKEGSSQGAKELNQKVEILSMVQHIYLVKLKGACAETRALIYEYLPNGSLEDRLRCKNNTLPLSWQARVRIAFEICTALTFLHSIEPHGIVHGDLKPENILFDVNDTSKICDFGLCCELNFTDCPKGTLAYMDPEYFSTGNKITPQCDVYSLGILLLRLATCKNPQGIWDLVEEAQKKGTLKSLIDASAGPWPFEEANKMISLGLRCSDPMIKNRPDLSTEVSKEIFSMGEVAIESMSSSV